VGCTSPTWKNTADKKTNAADASIFLIFANLDPSKGYKGITCFVAEKEWGVQIAKKEKKVYHLKTC
jgi:alkylation response protein AidB-like acyl-CoA dehydrogenase